MAINITEQIDRIESDIRLIQQSIDSGSSDLDLLERVISCRTNLESARLNVSHTPGLGTIVINDERIRSLTRDLDPLAQRVEGIFNCQWIRGHANRTAEQIDQAKHFLRLAAARNQTSILGEFFRPAGEDENFFIELFEIARSHGNEEFLIRLSELTFMNPNLKSILFTHSHTVGNPDVLDILRRSEIYLDKSDIRWVCNVVKTATTDPTARTLLDHLHQFARTDEQQFYKDLAFFFSTYDSEGTEGLTVIIRNFLHPPIELLSFAATIAFINGESDILRSLSQYPGVVVDLPPFGDLRLQGSNLRERFQILVENFPSSMANSAHKYRFVSVCIQNGDEDTVRYFLEHSSFSDFGYLFAMILYNSRGIPENIIAAVREFAFDRQEAHTEATTGLTTSFERIQEDPLKFFNNVVKRGFPVRILLEGTPAIDVGGPFKEFVFNLVDGLKKGERSRVLLNIQDNGFPKAENSDHSRLDFFSKLGTFLSLLNEKNASRTDKILIGPLFTSEFFETLRRMSLLIRDGSLKDVPDDLLVILCGPLLEADGSLEAFRSILKGPTEEGEAALLTYRESVETFCELVGIEVHGDGLSAIEIYDIKKTQALAYARERMLSYLNPIKAMLDGSSDSFKAFLEQAPAYSISSTLQGEEASAELLLASFAIPAEQVFDTQDQEAFFRLQISWIQEKIRDSSPEWRKNFIKAITGNPLLRAGARLRIQGRVSDNILEIHTCFNSIDLSSPSDPESRISRDVFLAELDRLVATPTYNTR